MLEAGAGNVTELQKKRAGKILGTPSLYLGWIIQTETTPEKQLLSSF